MTVDGLDPRLLRLVAAPYVRARMVERMSQLVERYRLLLSMPEGPAPAAGPLMVRLLLEHPSALLERAAVPRAELASRLDLAEAELRSLKAAAPIPAPPGRDDRAFVLALADFAYFFRELRMLRRGLAKMPAGPLLGWYGGARPKDPLAPLDEDMIRAIGRIGRGRILRVSAELASLRHGVEDLRARLAPPRPPKPPGPEVYACRVGEIPEGRAKLVQAHGRGVAVFNSGGKLHAIDDHCPHRGGPISRGDIEEGCAVCPLHGWAFDLETGAMRGSPRVCVPVYELVTRGDEVFIGPRKLPKP